MTYPILTTQDYYPYTASRSTGPGTSVVSAIHKASARTGVSFSYLVNNAKAESSLDPTVQAKTSSASGLYQFTQKTWLQMIRDHGAEMGLSRYASCVDGDCRVANPSVRQNILALRQNPEISAVMAAKYAEINADHLQKSVGGAVEIGDTELYLAHVFGANGATKFLNALQDNPDQPAARVFPTEARVNKGLFYQNGTAQTLQDIYDRFAEKFDTPHPTEGAGTEPPSQEDDMIGQVNNNGYRTWIRRPGQTGGTRTFGATPQNAAHITDSGDTMGQHITDNAVFSDGNISGSRRTRIPAHRALSIGESQLQTDTPGPEDTLLSPLNQPALLVMAQGYRHNQADRYNG